VPEVPQPISTARVDSLRSAGGLALVRTGSADAPGQAHEQPGADPLDRRLTAVLLELTKPRITRLVTLTAAVGFVLALKGLAASEGLAGFETWRLALVAGGCLIGTALAAAGANALNMWWERDRDALMERTFRRPLPSGRISLPAAFLAGSAMGLAGVLVLGLTCGLIPAALALLTLALYVLAYTPLKTISTLNTLVGAVPGAMPPLIGWTAATSALSVHGAVEGTAMAGWAGLEQAGGWSLVVLMFVWQIPHVCALAWMYREDYQRAGYRMLPILDPDGRITAWTVLVWSALLLVASLVPAAVMPDRLGWVYAAIAAASGAGMLVLAVRLVASPTRPRARAAFFGTIIHLPLLLAAMVGEVVARWVL
jgi:protoheme IX farnesyltransferase